MKLLSGNMVSFYKSFNLSEDSCDFELFDFVWSWFFFNLILSFLGVLIPDWVLLIFFL